MRDRDLIMIFRLLIAILYVVTFPEHQRNHQLWGGENRNVISDASKYFEELKKRLDDENA